MDSTQYSEYLDILDDITTANTTTDDIEIPEVIFVDDVGEDTTEVTTHIINGVKAIVGEQGRVFNSIADMNAWLAVPANVAKLKPADEFRIKDDTLGGYWWDGTQLRQNSFTITADISTIEASEANEDAIYYNIGSTTYEKGMLYKVYTEDGSKSWVKFRTDKTVTFRQDTASTQWTIAHNLDRMPVNVLVKDSGGTVIIPDIVYIDKNTIRLDFAYATSGRAIIN